MIFFLHADAAVGADDNIPARETLIGSVRNCVELGWHLHLDRLVGPFLNSLTNRRTWAAAQGVRAWRPGCLGPERAVRAVVATILVRVARPKALDRDIEPPPEHRKRDRF